MDLTGDNLEISMCVWSAVHTLFNDWSFVDKPSMYLRCGNWRQNTSRAQQRLLSQDYKQITYTQTEHGFPIHAALLALQFCCFSFNSPDYVTEASPT